MYLLANNNSFSKACQTRQFKVIMIYLAGTK